MPRSGDIRPTDDRIVTSRPVMMTPGEFVRSRALRLLGRWWLPVAVVLLATAALAFSDVRFVYVLLIELLIAFPMVLCLVWMSEALSDDALRETRPHTVTLADTGIEVTFLPVPAPDSDDEDYGAGTPAYPQPRPRKYNWTDFAAYHDAGNCVILLWTDRRRAPLRLPEDAFDDAQWHVTAKILARFLICQ